MGQAKNQPDPAAPAGETAPDKTGAGAGLISIGGGWEGSEELAELWSHQQRISRLHGSGQLFAEPGESVLTDDMLDDGSEVFDSIPPKSD